MWRNQLQLPMYIHIPVYTRIYRYICIHTFMMCNNKCNIVNKLCTSRSRCLLLCLVHRGWCIWQQRKSSWTMNQRELLFSFLNLWGVSVRPQTWIWADIRRPTEVQCPHSSSLESAGSAAAASDPVRQKDDSAVSYVTQDVTVDYQTYNGMHYDAYFVRW